MTNEIDYKEVLMHYSKPEIEGGMDTLIKKKKLRLLQFLFNLGLRKKMKTLVNFLI